MFYSSLLIILDLFFSVFHIHLLNIHLRWSSYKQLETLVLVIDKQNHMILKTMQGEKKLDIFQAVIFLIKM